MSKHLFSFLSLVLIVNFATSQDLPEIIPPSPTAASLAQFADVPVSEYTGLPNITIPIYTIKSGDLSLPISLNYHGGGIKVAQEASWVGLGWSLNAGGTISRIIKGHDDLDYSSSGSPSGEDIPYIYSQDVPNWNATETELNSYYKNIVFNRHDPEPDIFFYNFGSYSGKFIVEKPTQGSNEVKGRPLDAQAVSISYFIAERIWVITDPMGIKYQFKVAETTTNYSYSTNTSISNVLANRHTLMNSGSAPYPVVTSWYIEKISSPISEHEITFEYETDIHNTKSQIRVTEVVPKNLTQQVTCSSNTSPNTSPDPSRIVYGSVDVTQDVYLNQINFSNGYVVFDTEDRIDLDTKSPSDPDPQRLKDIKVYRSTGGAPIITANLNFDYFQKNTTTAEIPDYYRLKLEGVNINDQNYQFEYNDPGSSLPSKISLGIDHWGYFNNANNNSLDLWGTTSSSVKGTLIPGITTQFQGQTISVSGANRFPNENYTKYFVLKKIILPTGGSQTFNWESNEYFGTEIIENSHTGAFPNANLTTTTSGLGNIMNTYTSDIFEITDASVRIHVNFLIQKVTNPDYIANTDEHPYVGYYKLENGSWVLHQLPYLAFNDVYGPNSGYSINLDYENITTTFTPGKYKMVLTYLDNLRVGYNWSYTEMSTTMFTGVKGGGLRIQSVELDDGNETIVKKYGYLMKDSNKSSGIAMENPVYHYISPIIGGVFYRSGNSNCAISGSYLIGNSNNLLPVSGTGDNFIGYGCVQSSYEGSTNLGETITEYYNLKPISIVSNPPPNFPTESDPKNGKPFKMTIKKSDGITVDETDYFYKIESSYRKNAPGMFVYQNPFTHLLPSDPYEYQALPPYLTFYRHNNYTDWCFLESKLNVRYDLNGNNPITTRTNYSYENDEHLQLTKTETISSKGNKIITKIIYPDDISTASTLYDNSTIEGGALSTESFNAVKRLKHPNNEINGLHRIAEAIQTSTYEDFDNDGIAEPDELLNMVRNNFKDVGNDFVLTKNIQTLNGAYNASTNLPQERIVFHNYYDNGNLKEVSKKDGTHIVYIWGYNDEYPVAKIENATYSSIENLSSFGTNFSIANGLSPTQESDLRSLSGALVTTYTYMPLVGLISSTDPKGYTIYYEYDSSNRLKRIKDEDQNILSENQYNYKQ
ncbi:hypothetical protein SAMN05428642_103107 [Flaviramulus basaltis]|uniref:YD repeat-containing protein n=1 Tax=Flaviramulus basaltis TaxID=369401 RepID=A0A1K2IMF9_9FLAO|nr:hypothetical protein [Flaviramulus basaltis]SFZ93392.1 hypothetical protein SAMN05428642_103107 [Flaviramulus basaltis]